MYMYIHVLTSGIVLCRSLIGTGISHAPIVDTGVRVGTDELLTFVLPAHRLQRLHARTRGGENERLREEVREEGRGGKKREK